MPVSVLTAQQTLFGMYYTLGSRVVRYYCTYAAFNISDAESPYDIIQKKTGAYPMYDLGSRIKTIRQKRGITQRELALRINKSISSISSYETNAQLPPLDVVGDIAVTLNISLDDLVGTEKIKTLSVRNLTVEQTEILEQLLHEFHSHTPYSGVLTQEQILIIQKLIHYFITK